MTSSSKGMNPRGDRGHLEVDKTLNFNCLGASGGQIIDAKCLLS